MQTERQGEISYPGQDDQRERSLLCIVVDKGTLPATTPSAQITLDQPVNERNQTEQQEDRHRECEDCQAHREHLGHLHHGDDVLCYGPVDLVQRWPDTLLMLQR